MRTTSLRDLKVIPPQLFSVKNVECILEFNVPLDTV